jgi:WD40 repeat protein
MTLSDVASDKAKASLKTPGTFGDYNPHGVVAAAFTPDGKTLVSIAIPNEIRLWDVATGKQSKLQKTDQEIGGFFPNAGAAFSPDVKTVATLRHGDTTITLWDVATGKARSTLKGQGKVASFTFSPDGKTLASGDEKGTIRFWDVTSGKESASFAAHAGTVICLAFSVDGKVLASGGADKKIKLWNTAKSK